MMTTKNSLTDEQLGGLTEEERDLLNSASLSPFNGAETAELFALTISKLRGDNLKENRRGFDEAKDYANDLLDAERKKVERLEQALDAIAMETLESMDDSRRLHERVRDIMNGAGHNPWKLEKSSQ